MTVPAADAPITFQILYSDRAFSSAESSAVAKAPTPSRPDWPSGGRVRAGKHWAQWASDGRNPISAECALTCDERRGDARRMWCEEPEVGIEPTACALREHCSTTELLGRTPRD